MSVGVSGRAGHARRPQWRVAGSRWYARDCGHAADAERAAVVV